MKTTVSTGYCPRCGPDSRVGEKTGRCLQCGTLTTAGPTSAANGNGDRAYADSVYAPCEGCRWPDVCTGDGVCWEAARVAREAAARGRDALAAMDDGIDLSQAADRTIPEEPPLDHLEADDDEATTVPLAPGLAAGVTITLPEQPALHTRKLLKTLGAGFEIDPSAPGSCEHGDASPAKSGPADPPANESDVSPSEPGAAAESSASGGASTTPSSPTRKQAPKKIRRAAKPKGRVGRPPTWHRPQVIRLLQEDAARLGRSPTVRDWKRAKDGHPADGVVRRMFGSWAAGLAAAGLEPSTPSRSTPAALSVRVDGVPRTESEAAVDELQLEELRDQEVRRLLREGRDDEAEQRQELYDRRIATIREAARRAENGAVAASSQLAAGYQVDIRALAHDAFAGILDALTAQVALPNHTCAACGNPFRHDEQITLVPVGPGSDPRARAAARDGKPYSARAVVAHRSCATGLEDT